jgi:hypothetical protein
MPLEKVLCVSCPACIESQSCFVVHLQGRLVEKDLKSNLENVLSPKELDMVMNSQHKVGSTAGVCVCVCVLCVKQTTVLLELDGMCC